MRARLPGAARRLAGGAAMLVVFTASAAADAPPVDPTALLSQVYQSLYGADCSQVLRLTSKSPQSRPVSRKLSILRKYTEPPPRALIRFSEPPDIRGASLLVIEHPTRDADVFLYLPAFDRTKRITAAQRFDAFFGTNLTYEDLEPKSVADFEVRALGPDRVGTLECLRLELRPRPGVESQYDRSVACVETARSVILWIDYELKGRPHKRLEVDPESIRLASGRHLAFRSRVQSHATGAETEIAVEAYEAGPRLPDSLFTIPHLELGDERGPTPGR
jgi:hypothetical protein